MKAWHVPDTRTKREIFSLARPVLNPELSVTKLKYLPEDNSAKVREFKLWLKSKRYSLSTVKTYSEALKSLFTYYSGKPIESIDNDDIILFNNNFILKHKLSSSY